LIENQSADQITSVLAHEIGHFRKKHTLKSLTLSIVQTGIILFLFSVIVGNPVIYQAIGSSEQSFHMGLIIFMILYSPVSSIISIVVNYISRRYEFQADNFAVENSDPQAMASSLRLLTSDNLSDLTPHPWYVFLHYSHPPLDQRLENILKN
jgi:STE24 endopeptidase